MIYLLFSIYLHDIKKQMKATTVLRNTYEAFKCFIVVVEVASMLKTLVAKYKKPKKIRGFRNNSGKEEE